MASPSPECENLLRRHLANPFLVLELSPAATREEIERQGARLLAMLAAGMAVAAYATPLGTRERSPEMVRTAMAELRDPARRLAHESWRRGFSEEA